jgi:RyR domain
MNQQRDVEMIARACYEANVVYARTLGEEPLPFEEVKDSVMSGVRDLIADPSMHPAQSHQRWMQFKLGEGWVWGPKKDLEKKTHPQLVAYDQLPEEQRIKDYLFHAIVRVLARLPKGYVTV